MLSSTGISNPSFTKTASGNYYIVVKHRNHLETWSRLAQSFTSGTSVIYDFTTAANKAYGNNMKQVGSVWVFYGGDPNMDGSIDAMDISIFIAQFGYTGSYLSCDFNGDGSVDAMDVQIIASNFGLTKAVPATDINFSKKNINEPGKEKDNIQTDQNIRTEKVKKSNLK